MQGQGQPGKVSKDISTEPPIGGWNTRDSLDNIPPTDAIIIDNWTCGLGSIKVRDGSLDHAYSFNVEDHVAGKVMTLMKYDSGDVQKLFACDGGLIWDATSPGQAIDRWEYDDGGGSPVPFTNDVFSWANFRGGLGDADYGFLVAVNGNQSVIYYNKPSGGFGFYPLEFDAESSISPIGCYAYKNRMYYWESNSQSIWYTDLYAAGGLAYEVQLGGVGQFGGSVITIESVTHDGGSGTDDYLLIYMSGGEVLMYQGSYPDDEADWAIVGIYNPGLPMGPRAFAKLGGDLMMMTDLDILPMSKLLKGVEANVDLTKISGAMQRAAPLRGTFGFQVEIFPPSKLMIFNVPQGTEFVQFVMNTVTGAWSRWTGIQSYCWLEFDGELYFGTDSGMVFRAEEGAQDTVFDLPQVEPAAVTEIPYNYTNVDPLTYGYAGSSQLPAGSLYDAVINANYYDSEGVWQANELAKFDVGDEISIRTLSGDATLVVTIEARAYDDIFGSLYGSIVSQTGKFAPGAEILLDVTGATGTGVRFDSAPIKSHIQTAWLRFGIEEVKQWDAVKLYLRSTNEVFKNISTQVDYREFAPLDYPQESVGTLAKWSAEWAHHDPVPATLPDPTTWWTDEGDNPQEPINDTTGRGSQGAVTKWSIGLVTNERWDIVSGVGRAISLMMKLNTRIPVEWNLTFWHAKMGSRM